MPHIHIRNTGQVIEINLVTSILVALQINQIPIENVCGGKAKCGKCAIRIISGGEYLTPKRSSEVKKIRELHEGSNIRLACQAYTRGNIEIEVINIKD